MLPCRQQRRGANGVRRMAKQDLTRKPASVTAALAGEAAAQAIRAVVARIPPGHVSSYGEIAARAGLPGRARLTGKVLGKTDDGVELPWFRVLRADGRIAFPAQSRAYREQRARLIAEGVRVERGRVDLARFGWDRNLDYELWAPPSGARPSRKPATKKAPADRSPVAPPATTQSATRRSGPTTAGATKRTRR